MRIGNRRIANVAFATAFALGTALVSTDARAATVLYDNLSATSAGSDGASVSGQTNSEGPLYNSFSTNATAYTVGSFSLLLSGDPTDGLSFTVGIYNDSFTMPGAVIASTLFTWNDNILQPTPSVIDFSFTPVVLDPSTRYWIGLSSNDSGSASWWWTTSLSGAGVGTEFVSNATGTHPNSAGPYQMEVSATPVPTSWIMMLSGLASFGFLITYRRRKKCSTALADA